MSILITGATGYIGTPLVLKLAKAGNKLHLLCRRNPNGQLSTHPNTKIFLGNITNKTDVVRAMKGCKQVYHLAAYARVWARNSRLYHQVNVLGTKNILESALEQDVEKLVLTSTGAVFGPSNGVPVDEYSSTSRAFSNEYARSKLKAEKLLIEFTKKGLKAVIANPTRVYGPGPRSKSNSVSDLIESYMQGNWRFIPGDGSLIANYVFIDDVVEGHIAAMKYGKSGEQYILGGVNASYEQLFKFIEEETSKSHKLYRVPIPLIKLASRLDVLSAILLKHTPSITPSWVDAMSSNAMRSCEKARKEIGYTITPIKTGIQNTVQWLNNGEDTHENR